jgi:hypothetical protein
MKDCRETLLRHPSQADVIATRDGKARGNLGLLMTSEEGKMKKLGVVMAALSVMAGPSVASADLYTFYKFSSNTAYDLESQFTVDVVGDGAGQLVDFTFRNVSGVGTSTAMLTKMYFYWGAFTSATVQGFSSLGVGSIYTPTSGYPPFGVDPYGKLGFINDGGSAYGVNPGGDFFTVHSTLTSHTVDQLLADLSSGAFVIGLRVQFTDGAQFEWMTSVAPVPVPGAVLLGVPGLSVAGWRLKRKTI